MGVAQRIDRLTYERLAVREGYRFVELRDGVLVEKPPMTFRHAMTVEDLGHDLRSQIDRRDHMVFVENARLRVADSYLIPDIAVVPTKMVRELLERTPNRLAVYDEPISLVVEVWSPSTGQYDVATKVPLYQARGDREIWCVQPVDRTLTAWARRDGGTYPEQTIRAGTIECAALPGVRIDLAALLA